MMTAEIDTGFARIKMQTDTIGVVHVSVTRDDNKMIFVLTSSEAEFIAHALRILAKGAP